MKNVILALAVLVCVLLNIMPVIASDYTLNIFGNANMDKDIDEMDIAYVEGVIRGTNAATNLSDANYDGKIDNQDISQIKDIISGTEKTLTVVDSADRIVTVKKPAKRIVATFRHALEKLRLIGVGESQVVGVESIVQNGSSYGVNYKSFFPEYQDTPTVGVVWTPDVETILSLKPDIVFLLATTSSMGKSLPKVQDVLESADITVIRIYANVYGENIQEEAKMMGYIFDKEEKADEFNEWYDNIRDSINDTLIDLPENDKPTVYFETGNKWNSGDESSTARVGDAGGKNIFPDTSGSTNPEAIMAQNPDFIIKGVSGVGSGGYDLDAGNTTELKKIHDEIMSRPELQTVKAVKDGHVYVISGYILSYGPPSGGRGFLQIVYMAKWLHPDLFKDLDPQAIHLEYLTRFQGLDFDLDKKGVFVYPPQEL